MGYVDMGTRMTTFGTRMTTFGTRGRRSFAAVGSYHARPVNPCLPRFGARVTSQGEARERIVMGLCVHACTQRGHACTQCGRACTQCGHACTGSLSKFPEYFS
jgi:hypothetical protein